jgi:uncharacterized protein Yka (UPF0111/DUF47 family)
MDDETKAAFDSLMARMNDQFERVLDLIETFGSDFRNTKSFLIEDAIVLSRRLTAVEHRLDDLERKP